MWAPAYASAAGTGTIAVCLTDSGGKPFTQDMELLPGTYTFHFSDSTPNTAYALSGGATTIH